MRDDTRDAWSDFELVSALPHDEREHMLHRMGTAGARLLATHWTHRARRAQLPPGGDWLVWLVLAGRGFGKTRTGAQWVNGIAMQDGAARIALIGASLHEARMVMVEGESGVLATAPAGRGPHWQPARRRLVWPNGATATLFGAAQPDSLRGAQHSHMWGDEIAKWSQGEAAWDNAMMGLRLGDRPRALATTTPRPVPLVRRLLASESAVVTTGRTRDNRAALPAAYLAAMERDYGGTRLGRQELDGEMVQDIDGALWPHDLIVRSRVAPAAVPDLVRVVIGVDPPASATGDACGIIVAGADAVGTGWILADETVSGASPEQWARAVARASQRWCADRVVAEANNGGAMVASVLRAVDSGLPVRLVHARRGKSARAEPVAALYEAGRVYHAGQFASLEQEMQGLVIGGGYQGPGRSPDRADALVWALTCLLLENAAQPHARMI